MSDPTDTARQPDPGGFALQIDDDLLAAAVAAVEKRTRRREPDPEEMASFEDDIVVGDDEDQDGDGDDGDDLGDAFQAGLRSGGANDPVAPAGTGESVDDPNTVGVLFDRVITLSDVAGEEQATTDLHLLDATELQEQLSEAMVRADELAASLSARRKALDETRAELDDARMALDEARAEHETLSASAVQERQDKRKAMALARRWKERAERAEQRLEVARQGRDAAEERALRAEAAVAEAEEEGREALRRAAARRTKELADVRVAAPAKVLGALLPAIDNFDLALAHADQDPARVIEGLGMIQGQFAAALSRLGVERVPAGPGTPFSPDRHEAFSQEVSDTVPAGSILAEVAAGYRLGGRLLRAAKVVVAVAPPQAAEAAPTGAVAADTEGHDAAAPADPTPAPAAHPADAGHDATQPDPSARPQDELPGDSHDASHDASNADSSDDAPAHAPADDAPPEASATPAGTPQA